MFLVLKIIFLKSCKIFRELSITESNYSNVAGATLLKSLSAVDILLPVIQEFRYIFPKFGLSPSKKIALFASLKVR